MANVLFKRGSTATINGTAIADGQLLYNTTTGQHYIDSGSTRKEVGKPVVNTTAEVSAITADNIPCGTKPVKELITSLNGVIESSVKYDFFTKTVTTKVVSGVYYYDLDVSSYVTDSANQVLNVHGDLVGIQSNSFRMQTSTTVRLFFSDAVSNKVVNFSIMYKN